MKKKYLKPISHTIKVDTGYHLLAGSGLPSNPSTPSIKLKNIRTMKEMEDMDFVYPEDKEESNQNILPINYY